MPLFMDKTSLIFKDEFLDSPYLKNNRHSLNSERLLKLWLSFTLHDKTCGSAIILQFFVMQAV